MLLENIRFDQGELSNESRLSNFLSNLGDGYVMDAFAASHRKHASTFGAIECSQEKQKPVAAGLLLEKEFSDLQQILDKPKQPVLAIVGGSKVSTKLKVLYHLIEKVDHLILGGGITNTFLLAQGFNIGLSLVEEKLVHDAQAILDLARQKSTQIYLPKDVVVANSLTDVASKRLVQTNAVPEDAMILDVGAESQNQIRDIVFYSKTILWNGPLGVFEKPEFAEGTLQMGLAIAEHTDQGKCFSMAGGGDTLAAVHLFKIQDSLSALSTAGGAFLECIEGKELPSIRALTGRAS